MTPDYQARLTRLQALLANYQAEALLVEDSTNLYYLTGIELSAGTLIVWPDEVALVVDGRYLTACRQQLIWPIYEAGDDQLKKLLHRPHTIHIGIDADLMTVSRYAYWQELCTSHQKLVRLHSPLNPLRMIKDETELALLQVAAQLGSAGYDYVLSLLQPGCIEGKVADTLEIFWKKQGAQGPSFSPIIAFGPHSALPHYRADQGTLQFDDIALIDIGVQLRHYHSDMSRVQFFGQPDPRLKEIYAIVREAQAAALALCRPGITAGALDQAARAVITQNGYGDCFSHSLGHGVGLDIHEAPRLSSREPHASVPLQAGMVITIEPGIYLPNLGGVRLENTIVITAEGYRDLTERPL